MPRSSRSEHSFIWKWFICGAAEISWSWKYSFQILLHICRCIWILHYMEEDTFEPRIARNLHVMIMLWISLPNISEYNQWYHNMIFQMVIFHVFDSFNVIIWGTMPTNDARPQDHTTIWNESSMSPSNVTISLWTHLVSKWTHITLCVHEYNMWHKEPPGSSYVVTMKWKWFWQWEW